MVQGPEKLKHLLAFDALADVVLFAVLFGSLGGFAVALLAAEGPEDRALVFRLVVVGVEISFISVLNSNGRLYLL